MKKTYTLISMAALAASTVFIGACGPSDEPTELPNGDGDGDGDGDGSGGGTPGGGGTAGDGDGDTVNPGTEIFNGTGAWVDGAMNTAGIQGSFFVLEDSMENGMPVSDGLTHTDFTPDTFDDMTAKPCVSGTLAAVTDADGGMCDASGTTGTACEWSAIWGGGIGLNLNETGGEDSMKMTYDASSLTGFTFQTSGMTGGAVVRFKAKMEGSDSDFCTAVPIGANEVALADLKHNCYTGGMASETLDVTKLVQLEWQIVPEANTSYEVSNFCIEYVGVY